MPSQTWRVSLPSHSLGVIPSGHKSCCCQAPANVGKADPNTEPHAPNREPHTPNTICLPSLRCQRRRQLGTRQHTGEPSHTAPSNNFSSVPTLAGQQSVPGGAARALNTPCVTHVGHLHSTALGTRPAGPHQAGDLAPGWIFQLEHTRQTPPKEVPQLPRAAALSHPCKEGMAPTQAATAPSCSHTAR